MQQIKRLNMQSRVPMFFILGFEGVGEGFYFLVVPNVFNQISNVFLKLFLIAPYFYPICFGQNWTFM